MFTTCSRRIEFDAGHRIVGHKNKCQYLHGHRYVLEVHARISKLDNLGFVADFGELKQILKPWIDDHWDHNVILNRQDEQLGKFIAEYTGKEPYYIDNNPSAENIASYLLHKIIPKLFKSKVYEIYKIKLYETPNCSVEVTI